MSRSLLKNDRIYIDGYDMSGYTRTYGPLTWEYDEAVDDALSASVKGTWNAQASIGVGTINVLFDNTATVGAHARFSTQSGTRRNVMIARGMEAVPANNGLVFCGQFSQSSYVAAPAESPVAVSVGFVRSGASANNNYAMPWGTLLHASGAETAVNSTTYHDGLAATAVGGYMMYQVLTSAGTGDITATFKVQDSVDTTDGNFGDLLTSGVINTGSGGAAVPTSGVIALSPTAAVKRYTRWQIVLGTASSVTFVLAFVRNYHN